MRDDVRRDDMMRDDVMRDDVMRDDRGRNQQKRDHATRLARIFASLVLGLFAGCEASGPELVQTQVLARGVASPSVEVDGWALEFDVARLGFGPLYLCTTAAASADLCPSALAELVTSTTVDLLDPSPQPLGTLAGHRGEARSATWDYGISHVASWTKAKATAGAPSGHSAIFHGKASKGGRSFRFVLDLDMTPQHAGTRVVQGAPVALAVAGDGQPLVLTFDLAAWWSQVDIDAIAATPGDALQIAGDSAAANALIIGLTANAPPKLRWGEL